MAVSTVALSRSSARHWAGEKSSDLTTWVEQASRESPVNRLDDLAMIRHKFTLRGDFTFDRLREKNNAALKASLDASHLETP